MKSILKLIILTPLLLSYNKTISQENSLTKDRLKGNIKSVNSKSYMLIDKFGEITKVSNSLNKKYINPWYYDYKTNIKTTYNQSGNIVDKIYLEGNKIVIKEIYKYNKKNKLSELNSYSSDGKIYLKTLNKYDNEGNLIEEEQFNYKNNSTKKTVYRYDNSIQPFEYDVFNLESELPEKHYIKYGVVENSNTTYEEDFWNSGNSTKQSKLVLTKGSLFDKDNNNIETNLFTFSAKFNEDGDYTIKPVPTSKINRKFSNNNPIKLIINLYSIVKIEDITDESILNQLKNSSELKNITPEEFNKTEIEFTEEIYHTYEYKYDNHDNWIERIMYEGHDKIPKIIVEREIIYQR